MKWVVLLICFVFTCLLILLIATINRGFDLTDEGFYLQKIKQVNFEEYDVFSFQKAYYFLFGSFEVSIVNTRIIRLLLTIISSALIAAASIRSVYVLFGNIKVINNLTIILFILIGGFVSYGFGPQSISYNSLTSNFVIITVAFCMFYILSDDIIQRLIFSFLIGIFTFLVILGKVSSGIVFAPAIIMILLLAPSRFELKILYLFSFLIGIFVISIIYSVTCHSIISEIRNFIIANEIIQSSGRTFYTSHNVIISVLKSSAWSAVFLLAGWLIVVLFTKWNKKISFLLENPIIINLLFLSIASLLFTFTGRNYLFFPVTISLIYFIKGQQTSITDLRLTKDNVKIILIVILLLLGPYFVTVGTSVSMFNSTLFSMSLWFGLIIILMRAGSRQDILFNKFVLILAISMSLSLIIHNHLVYPYRCKSLWKQQISVSNLNKFENIYVDKETYDFLTDVNDILLESDSENISKSIIGISKLSGVIYLLNGISFGGAYWQGESFTRLYEANLETLFKMNASPNFLFYRGESLAEMKKSKLMNKILEKITFNEKIRYLGKVNYKNQNKDLFIFQTGE